MNKYKTWYNNIINRARNRVIEDYTELHHIVPRSLGGNNDLDNLVSLTAREHFICHILLTKFTTGEDKNKMLYAAILMKGKNDKQPRYINSRLYENIKRLYTIKQKTMTGEKNSFYGRKHSDETRAKMSASKKALYSNGKHPHIGMKRSEEAKANISKARKGQPSPKKGIAQGPMSEETKTKLRESRAGSSFWWTNGVNNVRASVCPIGYTKGRTLSSTHKKALTK
jgi:hypothetical protein